MVKKLINYVTVSGKCPVRNWLNSLDNTVSARIETRLKRIAFGNLGDTKPVGHGVSEIRLSFGSGYRLYFSQHGVHIVVLLCGGDKSSQADDIVRAKNYWADFRRRNNV